MNHETGKTDRMSVSRLDVNVTQYCVKYYIASVTFYLFIVESSGAFRGKKKSHWKHAHDGQGCEACGTRAQSGTRHSELFQFSQPTLLYYR
jgi:hypothetical protein